MRRRSVDFPAPERPIIPTIWPAGNSKLTSFTATTSPKRFCKLIRRNTTFPNALCRQVGSVGTNLTMRRDGNYLKRKDNLLIRQLPC